MTAPTDPVQTDRMLDLEPTNSLLHMTAAMVWIFQGNLKRAQKSLENISPTLLEEMETSAKTLVLMVGRVRDGD